MKISVISVTYNSGHIVKNAINDLINRDDIEIFIVDNDSSDETCKIISEVNASNIKIIKNAKNIGYGRANNLAINQAIGEYILLLNPDAIISYSDLKKLAEVAERGDMAILSPKLVETKDYHASGDENHKIENRDYVIFGCVLISKKAIDKIGVFDEKIFMYYEDLDMCKRAHKAGLKVCECTTVQAYHEGSGSSLKTTKVLLWKEYQFGRAKVYYKAKYHANPSISWLLCVRYILKYIISTVVNLAIFNKKKLIKSAGRLAGTVMAIADKCNN